MQPNVQSSVQRQQPRQQRSVQPRPAAAATNAHV